MTPSEPPDVSMERYRATLPARTPDGETVTLIITRQAAHQVGPVWLSFLGSVRTTVALPDADTDQLVGLLRAAQLAGGARVASSAEPSRAAVEAAAAVVAGDPVLRRALTLAYEIDRRARG